MLNIHLTVGIQYCYLHVVFVLKEGIQYLEESGHAKLLELQGLKDATPEKPAFNKDSTMVATAKVLFIQKSLNTKQF